MRKALLIFTLLCVLLMPRCGVYAQAGIDSKKAPPRIDIRLHTNKEIFKVGEPAIITLVADRDCFFVLYYVDSRGNAKIVAPSSFCTTNALKGKGVLIIKDTDGHLVEQKGPPGTEYMQVIASSKPIDTVKFKEYLDHVAKSKNGTNPELFVTLVSKEFSEHISYADKLKGSDKGQGIYGVDTVKYQVIP